ncbi:MULTISPECIES: acyltransferase family protein [Pantoea]|nr:MULTISPECIES: acyltransferase [Pantoea]
MDNRNCTIDCFRAMAVILVSFYHVYRHINPNFTVLGLNVYNPILNGWMGVGIFFVISGYCMGMATNSMQSRGVTLTLYRKYLAKRFFRISVPYYFAVIFWIVAVNIFHLLPKSAGLIDIFTHVLYIHNFNIKTMYSISGVFWSLAVEMQFYLMLPVLMVIFNSDIKRVLLVIFLFGLSLSIHLIASDNVILTWGIASYLYVFILGWVLYLKKDALKGYLSGRAQLYFLIALYVSMMCIDPIYIKVNKFYELLVSSVFGLLMVSVMSQSITQNLRNSFFVRFFSWIGRMSFSIYLYNYIYVAFGFPSKSSYGIPLVAFILVFGIFMYYMVESPYEIIRKRNFNSSAMSTK